MSKLIGKISSYVICIIVGVVFIYSAYTKLFPVEYFEYTFVDLGFANWHTAPFFARILIGVEAFTGLILIFQIRTKRFAIPLAAVLLIIFCIHLIAQIIMYGNEGNCGCFGNALIMTPMQALIKNAALLLFLFVAYGLYPANGIPLPKWLLAVTAILTLTVPFILNPVDLSVSASHDEEALNYPIDVHWLYENPNDHSPAVDLTRGKHIIAFFSVSCPHCRLAAYKLHVMYKRDPKLPIYVVLNGDKSDLPEFFEETKSDNLPHVLFKGENYLKMSGPKLPAIYWVKDGIVVNKINYMKLSQEEIEKWLSE